jgi:hypothetical protein
MSTIVDDCYYNYSVTLLVIQIDKYGLILKKLVVYMQILQIKAKIDIHCRIYNIETYKLHLSSYIANLVYGHDNHIKVCEHIHKWTI